MSAFVVPPNDAFRDHARTGDAQVRPAAEPATSRRRTVLATLTGSTAVTVIVAVQALVLAPLFLRELGTPLYGAWLATGELLVWLQAFDLGLPNLLIQRIGAAHARDDRAAIGEYLASALVVLGMIALVLGGLGALLAPSIAGLMGLSGNDARTLASALSLASIATASTVGTNAVVGFARGVQQTGIISAVMVVSVLAGFATTLALLLSGWGVWAPAIGIATRSLIVVAGAAVFVVRHLRRGLAQHFRVRRRVLQEILSISPVTALGGLAYAGMNQSETALVAILGRPDLAAAYALTRRAADLVRVLVDTLGMAAYGSFAHLVASKERGRSLAVHSELTSLRLSLTVAAIGAYLAVNASLIGAWIGPALFLGLPLTVAFAVQVLVVGQGYLLNYLYRATGAVAAGSWMLLVEALIRVPLMILLFQLLGVIGIPLGGVATAVVFGALALSWTYHALSADCPAPRATPVRLNLVRSAVIIAGCLVGSIFYQPSWSWVVTVAIAFTALSVPLLTLLDRSLGAALMAARSEFVSTARLFQR